MNAIKKYILLSTEMAFFSMFSTAVVHASEPTREWTATIHQQKESQAVYRSKAETLVERMTLADKVSLLSMGKRVGPPNSSLKVRRRFRK